MRYRPKDAAARLLFACGCARGLLGCDGGVHQADAAGAAGAEAHGASAGVAASEPVAPSAAPAREVGAEQRAARTHRAARCGECHEKMHREWRQSAHASAGRGELYVALRKTGDASCDRCHEPLRTLGVSAELARAEGVSCDVCHRMDRVEVRSTHAEAPLQLSGNTKYGPRCDARAPYFHKAECRPLFQQAEMCAACHLLGQGARGEPVPVHTEYADWLRGPYAARKVPCQSCHMLPGVEAELAVGEPKRDGVPDHGFWGRGAELRGTAISALARASWSGGALAVEVQLENARAGHYIPAGGPGQQLVLRVVALGPGEREAARGERVFERRLVDAAGGATVDATGARVQSDTRIAPLEKRRERLELDAPDALGARVELLRRTDPELSARLGLGASPEQPVLSAALALRSKGGERRVDAPQRALVRVEPESER